MQIYSAYNMIVVVKKRQPKNLLRVKQKGPWAGTQPLGFTALPMKYTWEFNAVSCISCRASWRSTCHLHSKPKKRLIWNPVSLYIYRAYI